VREGLILFSEFRKICSFTAECNNIKYQTYLEIRATIHSLENCAKQLLAFCAQKSVQCMAATVINAVQCAFKFVSAGCVHFPEIRAKYLDFCAKLI
jgi:hypothetical protein